ncbi:hypothetical protein SCLCIDRAFT_475435 [Scleroderma citrinum Foug A]|uniref:Uncharacterized protein n=1 Tax=Scleroderma citrinum Foug A TaxID=1036808 RepID=A0A0C3AKS8_9AGAM|nr:hypothetical protein SCLCIDRAFT_475435 [Scleroderma citrinum Foug A]
MACSCSGIVIYRCCRTSTATLHWLKGRRGVPTRCTQNLSGKCFLYQILGKLRRETFNPPTELAGVVTTWMEVRAVVSKSFQMPPRRSLIMNPESNVP